MAVILHGGEPLLAGTARLRRVCEELTSALRGIAELDLRIHTNGVQLSPRYLDLFDEFDVKVGISLDGDRAANDRHRLFANGRTSHPLVLRAVELLRQERYRHLDLGLLCTIDVRNDPVAVFDALAELDPPQVDFLLPHATWEEPPPRPDGSATAYASWLLEVFDRWTEGGRRLPVRLFSSVLSTLSGGPSLTESLGLAPTDLVVVETDGSLEQVDSLKSAYEGAAATGFDVFHHAFDEVAAHPGVRSRQLGLAGVSETCRTCPVVRSCGGGLYTHRYRASNGFDNPSVYCADLEALVKGIEERTAVRSGSPAVAGTAELVEAERNLNLTMLAALHAELGGRGRERWDDAWALVAATERTEEGAGALDEVLTHPYARSWLLDASRAAERTGPRSADGTAQRLAATVVAASVRAGLDLTVPLEFRDGRVFLPTLGELRVGGPAERGTVRVRATEGGLVVRRGGGGGELRIARDAEESAAWLPLRTVGGGGAPVFVLDDLDPYRDCFGVPVAPRLTPQGVQDCDARVTRAWALLLERVPKQAADLAEALTTLTPVLPVPAVAGGHGYGALGIGRADSDEELALGLLRAFRRSTWQAVVAVTDLYASDGTWEHRSPWRREPVPFSTLLSETFERVGIGLFDARFLPGVRQALGAMASAAELTVDGKRVLIGLEKEIAELPEGTSGEERPQIVSARGPR
ncbi:uncharacterized protein QFZ58_005699 [Streptomyces sp. B1I3]|nr:uncharacterized protein [Streptomyces sp. B1I3]